MFVIRKIILDQRYQRTIIGSRMTQINADFLRIRFWHNARQRKNHIKSALSANYILINQNKLRELF